METIVYFIRHAHADFSLENYHGRALSEQGKLDAQLLTKYLKDIKIDYFVSSSSPRARETIEPLARHYQKSVETYDELQELLLRGAYVVLSPEQVDNEIKKVFEVPHYKLDGGESRIEVEDRGVKKFKELYKISGNHLGTGYPWHDDDYNFGLL
jgi:2,3-bisphosphoglycerate-dependent phosphoglycerate mutase